MSLSHVSTKRRCEIQCEVLEFSKEHKRLDNLNYCKANYCKTFNLPVIIIYFDWYEIFFLGHLPSLALTDNYRNI